MYEPRGTSDAEPTVARRGDETPTTRVARPALELVPGALLANRYRIVSRLGKGGMGEVFRADDLRLTQPVALKFLTPGAADEHQLVAEVRLGREISHPNVCRVHDIVEVEGGLFISMEYIDGEDLRSLLHRIGRLPSDKALAIAREICAGLAAAHDRGILHRDLKPANVMIDGHGRARITDFGLAAFESGQEHGSLSGTPAYMAPEQFRERRATVASDVFALGLTLFELWTGRRIFSGSSLTDLLQQHELDAARAAVRGADEIEPAVKQVIDLCVSPDPSQRPSSVRAVLALLPGRDALDAAIVAGETPSPGVVAAAGERGDLSRTAAWLNLGGVAVAVLTVAILSPSSTLSGRAGLPLSPAELQDRAEKLIRAAGWSGAELVARDRFSWLYEDVSFVRARERGVASAVQASPANALRFCYRQSPRELIPHDSGGSPRVSGSDPSFDFPGMVSVYLTREGALREFAIVPPSLGSSSGRPDWSALVRATGIDQASLREVPPQEVSPVDNDQKVAWSGRDAASGTPVRIEAAALRGRPVWMSVITPWTRAAQSVGIPLGVDIAAAVSFVLLALLPVAVALLARRNLRRGQGDRTGAFRLAGASFVVLVVAGLLRMHHVRNHFAEAANLVEMAGWSLLIAACVWLAYVGVEPLARKRWPHVLISWTRILDGRWRDPMVGRDLLIGLAVGAGTSVLMHALAALPMPGAEPLRIRLAPSALASTRQVVFYLVFNLAEAMVRAAALVAFLVLLRGFLRKQWLTVVLASIIVTASSLDTPLGPMSVRIVTIGVGATALILLTLRFGVLSAVAAAWLFLIASRLPLTVDATAWYFGRSLISIAAIAAAATGAFVISLGGKSAFPGPVFEE